MRWDEIERDIHTMGNTNDHTRKKSVKNKKLLNFYVIHFKIHHLHEAHTICFRYCIYSFIRHGAHTTLLTNIQQIHNNNEGKKIITNVLWKQIKYINKNSDNSCCRKSN